MTDELVDGGPAEDSAQDTPADSGPDTASAGEPESLDDILGAVIEESTGDTKQEADKSEDAAAEAADKPKDAETEVPTGDKTGGESASPEGAQEQGEEDAAASVQAPDHWSAEDKKAFNTIPTPEAKRAFLDAFKGKEAGLTRKSQELSEQAKFADSIKGIFDDNDRQRMAMAGLDEISTIRQLASLQRYAMQDGPGYIRHVAKQLGVDLGSLVEQPSTETEDDPFADPQIAELKQQVSGVGDLVSQKVQEVLQQQELQSLRTALTTFQGEVDEQGNPKRPHFQKVQPLFVSLAQAPEFQAMPNGPEKFQKVYDAAVRAHPELGPGVVEQEAARVAAEQAAQAEDKRKQDAVEKAKRARSGVSTQSTTNTQKTHKADQSLDDILKDVTRELTVT